MQCLKEIIPRVAINIFHFVTLLLHSSVHIDHLQRYYSQRNIFIIHAGQYLQLYMDMNWHLREQTRTHFGRQLFPRLGRQLYAHDGQHLRAHLGQHLCAHLGRHLL